MTFLTVALFFSLVAMVSIFPSRALAQAGTDYILIPVALQVGEAVARDFSQEILLRSEVPEINIRLQVNDTNIDVRLMMTPGDHYVLEIIDIKKLKRKLQQLKN